MTDKIQIPLFPLQTVLFPGQLLPLHIFEERYRLMIQEILGGQASFGVVLIRNGNEVGETADPFDVGTTARVKQVDQLQDGTMNILCMGEDRFQINDLHHDKPYLTGEVELWPWKSDVDNGIEQRSQTLKQYLMDYLKELTDLVGSRFVTPATPDDPVLLTSLAGFALRINNREKQAILSTPTLGEYMDACIQTLRREISTLRNTASIPDIPDGTITITPN